MFQFAYFTTYHFACEHFGVPVRPVAAGHVVSRPVVSASHVVTRSDPVAGHVVTRSTVSAGHVPTRLEEDE